MADRQIPNECQMTTRQTNGGQDAKTLNKLSPQWNKKDKGIPRGRRNHPPSLAHRWWAGFGAAGEKTKTPKKNIILVNGET